MTCAKCGAALYPGEPRCDQCGHPVEAAAPEPVPTPPPAPAARPSAAAPSGPRVLAGHKDGVIKVAFSPDGRRALSVSGDGAMMVWDVETGRAVQSISGGRTSAVDFSRDGRRAICDQPAELRVWDMDSGRQLARLSVQGVVQAVAFSPDARQALYGAMDKSIRLIDVESGREIKRLPGHGETVSTLAWGQNGRDVLSVRFDADEQEDAILMWDVSSSGPPRRPERRTPLVSSVALSADGRLAAAGSMACNAYLWDVASGREIRCYEGHAGNVLCVAFAPNGRCLLTGSGSDFYDAQLLRDLGADNTVRVWDTGQSRQVCCFEGHSGNVNSIAVSPDGQYALSGSSDRTVRLWPLPDIARS
jgi:WD40 repeat protein